MASRELCLGWTEVAAKLVSRGTSLSFPSSRGRAKAAAAAAAATAVAAATPLSSIHVTLCQLLARMGRTMPIPTASPRRRRHICNFWCIVNDHQPVWCGATRTRYCLGKRGFLLFHLAFRPHNVPIVPYKAPTSYLRAQWGVRGPGSHPTAAACTDTRLLACGAP